MRILVQKHKYTQAQGQAPVFKAGDLRQAQMPRQAQASPCVQNLDCVFLLD